MRQSTFFALMMGVIFGFAILVLIAGTIARSAAEVNGWNYEETRAAALFITVVLGMIGTWVFLRVRENAQEKQKRELSEDENTVYRLTDDGEIMPVEEMSEKPKNTVLRG